MTTIVDRLLSQARTLPAATAIVSDEGALTWGELADLSLRLSGALGARGIARGDHVALLCSNRPAFLVAWFALANRGAVTVSMNTGLVADGLRYALTQSDAGALLVERALWEEKRADLEPVMEGCDLILFDDEEELFALARAAEPDAPFEGAGSDPCTLIYTSGTTGPPKGVVNSHRAYLACGEHTVRLLDLTPDDRIMVFLPLFHTNPQMYAVMSALTVGCSLALRPKLSVSRFFEDARRLECTGFTYVGTVLAMLASRVDGARRDHAMRFCIGGGAPREVWRAVEDRFGVKVHELYGMTEIGGWVTGNSRGESRFGTCGRARGDVEVAILDAEDRPVPPGTRGEITVRPREPGVLLSGYYRNPEASWAASRNLWFHTGDAGSLDGGGYLTFLGRIKEIIRRGGENISPAELETALLAHPDIEDAAVVGVPDPIWGEEIKAVVVASKPLDPGAVRNFLDGRVPAFMLPRFVQFAAMIPKTETQKIQRHRLREMQGDLHDLGA